MFRRFARAFVVCAGVGVLYAGPVAACVCPGEPLPAMPCCPKAPQGSNHSEHSMSAPVAFTSTAACKLAAANLLPAGPRDLPPPLAPSTAAPPPRSMAGFAIRLPAPQEPYDSAPIYLVTLRLRN